MRFRSGPVALVVGGVLVGLLALFWFAPTDPDREGRNPLIDRPAPSISARTSDGRPIALSDYRGRWVVVNFFATWCTPCIAEHPELVAWQASRSEAGDGQVISIAYEDSPRAVSEFFDRNGGEWPVIAEGADRYVLEYGVVKLPESFLVSPEGTVVHKFVGGVTALGIETTVAEQSEAAPDE